MTALHGAVTVPVTAISTGSALQPAVISSGSNHYQHHHHHHHHQHHSRNTTPLSKTTTKPNKQARKMLQITQLLGKTTSSKTMSAVSSLSTENNDYIVEFEHCHHHHHHQGSRNGTTTSIPPFRIIPPPALAPSAGTTNGTKHLQNSSTSCSPDHQRVGGGFRLFRTGLRHSKSSASSQPIHHRIFSKKRRMLPHRSQNTLSQSTLQTLNTTSSGSSSSSMSGVDEEHTNEPTGPINEYGDCSKDADLDIVVDDATATTTAQMMMDISDQYYCIGKYYQYELCQSQLALQCYYNAYHTAIQCYRNVLSSPRDTMQMVGTPNEAPTPTPPVVKEEECILSTTDTTATYFNMNDDDNDNDAATTLALLSSSTTTSSSSQILLEEIQGQIQLTKECIGRVHFELGNIDEALEML